MFKLKTEKRETLGWFLLAQTMYFNNIRFFVKTTLNKMFKDDYNIGNNNNNNNNNNSKRHLLAFVYHLLKKDSILRLACLYFLNANLFAVRRDFLFLCHLFVTYSNIF